MNEKQARQLLRTADEDEPVLLTPAVLQKLDVSDVQDGCGFQIGQIKGGVHHLGSGLVDQSQKMTVAARATAEKKAVGQRS